MERLTEYQRGSIFGAVIVALAFGFALWGGTQKELPKQQPDPQTQTIPHKRVEQDFWDRFDTKDPTAFYTFGLCVIAGLQAGLFLWQLRKMDESLRVAASAARASEDQARLARASLIASNRAWIRVRLSEDTHCALSRFNDRLVGSVPLVIENVGPGTAFDVNAYAFLFIDTGDRDWVDWQAANSERFRNIDAKRSANWIVGPQEERTANTSCSAPWNYVEAGYAFAQSEGRSGIPIRICGFINYRFISDPAVHQTRFAFIVDHNGDHQITREAITSDIFAGSTSYSISGFRVVTYPTGIGQAFD